MNENEWKREDKVEIDVRSGCVLKMKMKMEMKYWTDMIDLSRVWKKTFENIQHMKNQKM